MTSYEALINKLNDWCTAQIQDIKFYGEFREQMPNLATITEVYPLVFVAPVSSGGFSQFGTNTIDYTVDIYCVDIIQKNRGNINHIVSDCQLILNDIYVYYASDEDEEITIVGTPQVIPMNNADLDYVAGAVMTITFQVEGYTACAIPMNPITPGASLCEDGTYEIYNSAGTLIESGTVASGGSVTETITDSTAVVKNSAGTTLITESIPAEVSENIVVGDLDITINGAAFTSTPAEVDVNIVVKDTGGNVVGSKIGTEWIVPESTNDIFIKFSFELGNDTILALIDTDSAGVYTSTTDDGGSGTITFSLNGAPYAAFSSPLTLVNGDTLEVLRTITTASGWVKIIGTY